MKKIILSLVAITQMTFVLAQEMPTAPKFKFYGNVRVDAYYNSRQMEEAAEGFWLSYPKRKVLDVFGNDLYGNSMMGATATASRFGFDFAPFRVEKLKMNLSGRIETDFQGYGGSATMLRIRHAWLNMNFGKSDVMVGQNWHPFYDNCFPNVLDINGGSPYQPFARNPQLRYSYSANGIKLYGAALYQTQFVSAGPDGRSAVYQKNAKIPELVAGADYKINHTFKIGAAAEYKQLQPRTTAETENGTVAVNEKIQSTAFNAYVQYSQKLLTLQAKAIYGQNLSDLQMPGGYAATGVNERGACTYKPFNTFAGWISADYVFGQNSPFALNVFGGYSKNLGTGHRILDADSVYGNVMYGGKMLSEVWRGSANLSYNLPHWRFEVEYGYNYACYGDLELNTGKAANTTGIDGSRVLAVVMFMF